MGRRGPAPGKGGRPPKPLVEKVLEGNPGKRKLTVVEFPNTANLQGNDMPLPRNCFPRDRRMVATSRRLKSTRTHGIGSTSAAWRRSFLRSCWNGTP